jgi:PKHD-type hydroxylase
MLLHIPDVLSAAQVRAARDQLAGAVWIDSRSMAGPQADPTKDNEQLAVDDPVARVLGDVILEAIQHAPLFARGAFPLRLLPPMFNRYQGGHAYGNHVDNAVRHIPGTPLPVRADLSATLFLSDPREYEGGELLVEDTYGVHSVKLPAGHLVLYPSTSLHSIQPVTRGTRFASIFWVQSLIRDDGQRTVLFDLQTAIDRMRVELPGHPAIERLIGVYQNLLRRWSDV